MKSKRKPGPTSYSLKAPMDIMKGCAKKNNLSEEKFCSFIEDARVSSKETPGHKFNPKTYLTHSRELTPKILPENNKDSRIDKIKIDKSKPAPGDYNSVKAWKDTQLGNREYKMNTEKRGNFTDTYKKSKKYIPGAGHYKYEVKHVYSKISSGPSSMRSNRLGK